MPDLKQRLDAVDQIPIDDLWPLIRERFEAEAAGRVTPLSRSDPSGGPEVGWRKALTIAAVFVFLAAFGIVLVRSLTSEGVSANPPVEPRPAPAASGTLAYILDGDVYVAEADGSNAVKIADGLSAEECYGWSGEYWAEGPMWSPDGRYLAYRRFTDCGAEGNPRNVVISDAEGNVIAEFPTGTGWDIGWSPDSTRVAVWDDFGSTIGVYGLDGARQALLEMPPGWAPSGDHDPGWMPDGTSVRVDDVVVPLDGSTPRQLAPELPDGIVDSPDGSLVAYTDHGSLWVARSDGSEPREVFGRRVGDSIWSPTGDRIAFTTAGRDPASIALQVVDVATGVVTPAFEGERRAYLELIGFSPRGDRIIFSKHEDRQKGERSLWSVGVDGADLHLIVAGTSQGDWLEP